MDFTHVSNEVQEVELTKVLHTIMQHMGWETDAKGPMLWETDAKGLMPWETDAKGPMLWETNQIMTHPTLAQSQKTCQGHAHT